MEYSLILYSLFHRHQTSKGVKNEILELLDFYLRITYNTIFQQHPSWFK